MKAIILAAGEGSRLGNICKDKPKCLVSIEENSLLEIQINTLYACGIEEITVVRGYEAGKIDVPGLNYCDNSDYAETNMLASLLCARAELNDDVLILYSDILYEEQVVRRLIESTHDIALGVMVNWKESISQRDEVALEELEMVYFDSENRICQIGKKTNEEFETQGQFVGMMKCSGRGAEILKKNYDRLQKHYSQKPFGQAEVFEKASLVDLLQDMTDLGVLLHSVILERGWLEIDTPEDYQRAIIDTKFVRRLIKKKTDWDTRSEVYNGLDWVNRDELLCAMVDVADVQKDYKVLDVGTGTGKVLMALNSRCPKAEYYGVDINKGMISKIDPSYDFNLSISEMENLANFKQNQFNLVTARMVFHHANDLAKATSEIHRVLKPGAKFVLCEGNPPDMHTVPFYKDMFRFKEDRHTFLLDDMVNLLVKQGFNNITSRSIIMKDMSLNNWLDNSGLPFRNTDIIKQMHFNCDSSVQKAYNMKIQKDDILMDWKFSVVSGTK